MSSPIIPQGAYVGMVDGDIVHYIYCHYPEGLDRILLESYSTRSDVIKLIGMGDMSSIGTTLDTCCPHLLPHLRVNIRHISLETYRSFRFETVTITYLFQDGHWTNNKDNH